MTRIKSRCGGYRLFPNSPSATPPTVITWCTSIESPDGLAPSNRRYDETEMLEGLAGRVAKSKPVRCGFYDDRDRDQPGDHWFCTRGHHRDLAYGNERSAGQPPGNDRQPGRQHPGGRSAQWRTGPG